VSGAWPDLVRAVAARYGSRFHRGFVQGKLEHDPVYRALAADASLAGARSVLDLGCGRGILLALLAERARRQGRGLELRGIEARASHAAVARAALGADAEIRIADLRDAVLPRCHAACLIDVLHYLPEEAQRPLLGRVVHVLEPGGLLFVREIDRAAGVRGRLARAAERTATVLRGEPGQRFCFRTAAAWRDLLDGAGLSVASRPADEGTPFANVLLVGRRA
jgi:SAM-dependent methyltransferase